jgi:hypothetical protein
MADYTLTINIPTKYVAQFNEQGWSLCFAAGVAHSADGTPDFNVLAYTQSMFCRKCPDEVVLT